MTAAACNPTRGARRLTVLPALLLGVAASACCWVPLALAGLGATTGALGAKIAWIRPWALGVLALLLLWGVARWAMKRHGGPSETEPCCGGPPRFPMLQVVILGLSIMGAAAAPRLLHTGRNTAMTATAPSAPAGSILLVLSTPQFDCPPCMGRLPQSMAATPGVASVQMDFDKREMRIMFQPGSAVDTTMARWKKDLGLEGNEVKREAASAPSPGGAGLRWRSGVAG